MRKIVGIYLLLWSLGAYAQSPPVVSPQSAAQDRVGASRRYFLVPKACVKPALFRANKTGRRDVIETSARTVRCNDADTVCILKVARRSPTPDALSSCPRAREFSYQDLRVYLEEHAAAWDGDAPAPRPPR